MSSSLSRISDFFAIAVRDLCETGKMPRRTPSRKRPQNSRNRLLSRKPHGEPPSAAPAPAPPLPRKTLMRMKPEAQDRLFPPSYASTSAPGVKKMTKTVETLLRFCHDPHISRLTNAVGRLAQLVERLVYAEDVGSSSLSSPTILLPPDIVFVSVTLSRLCAGQRFGIDSISVTLLIPLRF